MTRLFLLSCVARKQSGTAPAADLYISEWFKKARRVAETQGDAWFILSAKHGLTPPGKKIKTYNLTLNKMGVGERRKWADRVRQQMKEMLPDADEVVVLAGERYREGLLPYLHENYKRVRIPMAGMGIGKQLRWLKHESTR